MKLSRIAIILMFLIGLLMVSACNSDCIISKNIAIDKAWDKNDSIDFNFEINNSLANFSFYINIRHSIKYPYRNLYFFVSTEFPDGNISNDTIECVLADIRGKWYGNGFGDIKENKILIREDLKFPITGLYRMIFVQAMREDELTGISDIGIQIIENSAN